MSDIITTLHPDNNPDVNLYPNIKKENVPNKSIAYNKLDDDVISLINSIVSLKPQVDTSTHILGFTVDKGIYVGSDTGEWYYWNGTQYVSGGIYQAIQINDGSVTYRKTNFVTSVIISRNIFNKTDPNIYIGTSGSVGECWIINSTTGAVERNQWQMDGAYSVSYLIPVKPNTTYYYSQNSEAHTIYQTAFYDINGNFMSMANNYSSQVTTPSTCYYIRINNMDITSGGKYQIEENSITSYVPYEEYYMIEDLKIDEDNIINKKSEETATPFIFNSIGVIGDSYSLGQIYNTDSTYNTTNERYSWFRQIAYKYNITPNSYAIGGINTRSWLTNQYGLTKLLSDVASDCYLLALGINDAYNLGHDYLGSISDIKVDYTQNEDTFYGNYGKIISNILINKPNAKIIMLTIPMDDSIYTDFNNAIIEIAEHFNIPYGITMDDYFFSSDSFTNKIGGHPTCIGYSGMGDAYNRVISKCIANNIDYFKMLNIE